MDKDTLIVDANEEVEELFNGKKKEFLNKDISTLLEKNTIHPFTDALSRAQKRKVIVQVVSRYREHRIIWKIIPLNQGLKNKVSFFIAGKLEKYLTHKGHDSLKFEDLIKYSPGLFYWKDKNSVYLGCNDEFAALAGLKSRFEVEGKTDHTLNWKSGASEYTKIDKKVVKTGLPDLDREEVIETSMGTVTILTNKVPLFDENQNVIGLLGISTNITELKKTQEELGKSRTREAHFKAMSSIGGMIAHELRTPLLAMELNAQNLKIYIPELVTAYREYSKITNTEGIRDYKLDYLDTLSGNIERSARYAMNTISTVLSGFHYSSSETEPIKTLNVNDVVKKSLSEYPLTKDQRALITFKCEKTYQAKGASNIIIHVIHNLMKNALQSIREAGKGDITIMIEKNSHEAVEIIFKDTGKGISDKDKEHIFEPFYTTKSAETSIGLGLYFCKVALEKMGSTIDCASKVGEYTTFTIKLKGL